MKRPRINASIRWVCIASLIVLPQMRRSMQRGPLQELADSIASEGQLHPILVAQYTTRDAMLAHLTMIRDRVYEEVPEPRPAPDGTYSIIVAGHRRREAHWCLWTEACSNCKELGRAGPSCWHAHSDVLCLNRSRRPVIEARVMVDPDPEEMIRKQLAENLHDRPDPIDAAIAYAAQYHRECKLAKASGHPNPTITAFARRHGRSPAAIKSAIAFASLPHSIRALAANGVTDRAGKRRLVLPYEGAVALAELLHLTPPLTEEDLKYWCNYGLVRGLRVPQWYKLVESIIAERKQTTFRFADPIDCAAVEQEFIRRQHSAAMVALSRATSALATVGAVGSHLGVKRAVRRVKQRVARVEVMGDVPPEIDLAVQGVQRSLRGVDPSPHLEPLELVLEAS